jgi:disulfide bond formation protein DsbB
VTVKSLQGSLSILNEDRVVLAGLSSKESITLPSIMASGKSRTMVAQAGEIKEERREEKIAGAQEWEYLGLNAIEWIAVGYAAALVGGLIYAFWPEDEKVRRAEQVPSCP